MTLAREDAEESKDMERLRVHADALLSLSSPAAGGSGGRPATVSAAAAGRSRRAMAAEGVFECKTCRRQFPSFQALGGHRTSHTRLQARLQEPHAVSAAKAVERERARVHECAVCGLEFSMGQALGGHMRRHRGEVTVAVAGEAQPEMPDLNYPPLDGSGGEEDDVESSEPPELLNLLV